METIKLKIHSTVDIITNSSTTIFTYQDGSVVPLKELIDEILKLSGSDQKADDCFFFETFLDDDGYYCENENCPFTFDDWSKNEEYLESLKLQILKGEIEKPNWMKIAEEDSNYDGYQYPTTLEILPKDEKYSDLANKLLKYLNSTSHEAFRDG